jgi:hypothetical protein
MDTWIRYRDGDVVYKGKGFGSDANQIIHIHSDTVETNPSKFANLTGNLQFGAHSISS